MSLDCPFLTASSVFLALGLGKQDRTATGIDFSGDVDTKQYTMSSYGALELSDKGSLEAVLGVAKATHKVGKSNTPVGTEHTIDKTVGLAIGKTDLNAVNKTIGAKTALLLVLMTNIR
jgi:hypothetical protein